MSLIFNPPLSSYHDDATYVMFSHHLPKLEVRNIKTGKEMNREVN